MRLKTVIVTVVSTLTLCATIAFAAPDSSALANAVAGSMQQASAFQGAAVDTGALGTQTKAAQNAAPAQSPWSELWSQQQQFRRELLNDGISFGAHWVMEGFRNFTGGISTEDTVPASTLDLDLTINTGRLFDLQGGEFYADMEYHAGRDPTKVLVGDLQIFDKQNDSPYLQIFQLWYQQRLFNDLLRIKIGKIDANTEFSVITNGLGFINSSTQVTPTLFVFPTTPEPMPAVGLFFTPCRLFYASFGLFYSNRSVHFLNFIGSPYDIQPASNGIFMIGETGLTWDHLPLLATDGDARLGVWAHTGTFPEFSGGKRNGVQGLYAIFDQTLWRPWRSQGSDKGLGAFLEYGRTDSSVASIYEHFGGGIVWKGLPGRPNDQVGFSPQYARLSPQADLPHNYELALETFYNFWLASWASVQPDLQYIIDPGGQYNNALVLTMRLKVNL